jgi:rubredoxin
MHKHNVYKCRECKFVYRFKTGVFKAMPGDAIRELKKCPGCGKKMEIRHE